MKCDRTYWDWRTLWMERRTSHFASFRLDQNEPNDEMDKKYSLSAFAAAACQRISPKAKSNAKWIRSTASAHRYRPATITAGLQSQPGCNHSRGCSEDPGITASPREHACKCKRLRRLTKNVVSHRTAARVLTFCSNPFGNEVTTAEYATQNTVTECAKEG